MLIITNFYQELLQSMGSQSWTQLSDFTFFHFPFNMADIH